MLKSWSVHESCLRERSSGVCAEGCHDTRMMQGMVECRLAESQRKRVGSCGVVWCLEGLFRGIASHSTRELGRVVWCRA